MGSQTLLQERWRQAPSFSAIGIDILRPIQRRGTDDASSAKELKQERTLSEHKSEFGQRRWGTIGGFVAIILWSTTVAFARSLSEQLGPVTAGAAVYGVSGTIAIIRWLWASGSGWPANANASASVRCWLRGPFRGLFAALVSCSRPSREPKASVGGGSIELSLAVRSRFCSPWCC